MKMLISCFGTNIKPCKTIYGCRPDKIDLQSRNLILRKMHFYKKTQKLIKKKLLLKTLKNIVILHIINKL